MSKALDARRSLARRHPGRALEWRCQYALELIDAVFEANKMPAFDVIRATLTVLDFGGISAAEFLKYLEGIGRK